MPSVTTKTMLANAHIRKRWFMLVPERLPVLAETGKHSEPS
jgi:hypothetical protein